MEHQLHPVFRDGAFCFFVNKKTVIFFASQKVILLLRAVISVSLKRVIYLPSANIEQAVYGLLRKTLFCSVLNIGGCFRSVFSEFRP